MTPLKTLRRDLSALLAAGMPAANCPLGGKPNPPAVVVEPSGQYVNALDYCTDAVGFSVALIAPPGDPPAVQDALDDMTDKVRGLLRGSGYKFAGVSGLTAYTSGDLTFPAVIADVGYERNTDA